MDKKPMDESIGSGRIVADDDVEGHAISGRRFPAEPHGTQAIARPPVKDADDDEDIEGHGTVRGS